MFNWNKYILFVTSVIVLTLLCIGLKCALDEYTIPQYSDSVFVIILAYFVTDKIYNKLNSERR